MEVSTVVSYNRHAELSEEHNDVIQVEAVKKKTYIIGRLQSNRIISWDGKVKKL